MESMFTVINSTNTQYSESKAWKNSGLYGIWNNNLCNTCAVLNQLS